MERAAKGGGSGGNDTSPFGMHDSPGNGTGGLSQARMRGLAPGRRRHGLRTRTARQPRHESLDPPAVARLLLSAVATRPECGANGHGRVTAAVTQLLAVALQGGFTPFVPQPPPPIRLATPARALVYVPRFAALDVGHLVRVHVSGFSKSDPQTHSQLRQQSWCGTNERRHAS